MRHKQFVVELQDQVAALQTRIKNMEGSQRAQLSAAQAMEEMLGALSAEQKGQLLGWLQASQGENHIINRVAAAAAPPPRLEPPSLMSPMTAVNGAASLPIAIGGDPQHRQSPMESDEDAPFTMSRSWDDTEAARSILNLGSPVVNGVSAAIPGNFALPSASVAAASSAPAQRHFTSFTPQGVATSR